MTPGLREAAKRAREIASASLDPLDHARANALTAAELAESDAALLAALTETGPTGDIPPWSQASREGESEGPLPF
jgi:hypothetical protein